MGKNKDLKDQAEDMEQENKDTEAQGTEENVADASTESTTETEEQEATEESTDEKEEASTEEEAPKIKTPEEQISELNDKYLRLYSEFDNYRKRSNREKVDIIKSASSDVIKELLPVLDDFERAIKANEDVTEAEPIKEGMQLIQQKLAGLLERKGLKPMDSIGKDFDVDHHEAITEIPAPSDDMKGKVVDAIEKGYFLNDRVLRFAKVVVGK